MFDQLVKLINDVSSAGFTDATVQIAQWVDNEKDIVSLVSEIGAIPESIGHDTTEEKLYSKASDIVLARVFREIGLEAAVISERADSADVQAKSKIHGYTLVADAKAFRLSRTAKNQKDYKVVSLSGWRQKNDFAVLCSPYFQYPRSHSQIYEQSIKNNVCLLSWEHLIFMLKNRIIETSYVDFSSIWGFGNNYSTIVDEANIKRCFMNEFNDVFVETIRKSKDTFVEFLGIQRHAISIRGEVEAAYWIKEKEIIREYAKKQAVEELIKVRKIDERISQIGGYTGGLFT